MSRAERATPLLDVLDGLAGASMGAPKAAHAGGVLWYWWRVSATRQRTDDDPTTPVSSPSWVARDASVPTGDTGAGAPSASSLHRGTERAVTDRTRIAPRSAQAA